jgi:hypothetical protein
MAFHKQLPDPRSVSVRGHRKLSQYELPFSDDDLVADILTSAYHSLEQTLEHFRSLAFTMISHVDGTLFCSMGRRFGNDDVFGHIRIIDLPVEDLQRYRPFDPVYSLF